VPTNLAQTFWLLAAVTAIGIPAYAWRVRGRRYAIFSAVVLAIALPGAVVMHTRLTSWVLADVAVWLDAAFVYSMAAAGAHLAALVRPRLRPTLFRLAVSIPGMAFIAGGALSGVWLVALLPLRAILLALGLDGAQDALRWLDLVPLAVAVLSVATSLRPVEEIVRIRIGALAAEPEEMTRLPVERFRWRRPAPEAARPLRIVQITDPHLGPWQPEATLRRRIDDLMNHDPDLVLLTGDFLTMEGAGSPGALSRALEPLRRMPGRCFAIYGNHDHEAPHEVRRGLVANGVRLLVDEETVVQTPVGSVQIVGADYVGRDRGDHIRGLLALHPRREGHLRLFLLHDPLGFRTVPKGDVDLTLSGHTHGGQLGLLSFGLNWTVLSRSRWPDHGLFGHGTSRLYVHRGTGHYGFPLRVGVPGEASLLELFLD
jgi:predicted MPP superfamily phosphohydrolase